MARYGGVQLVVQRPTWRGGGGEMAAEDPRNPRVSVCFSFGLG
ncbi:hypothetical protein ES332_D09G054100v1 [Gossypium tomentosum]|uniref:Uncharacterized protein n=1 Tax=Gossypium tomentosum TaxID=34277 RepID=A0A5D2JD36_GOSTO|nr:hypothetical protein ES332_D09G054100v1 [Gossypium tomentosum]